MSVSPGNDPFSGSNTKNILQHIISPKIVDTGSGAHAVKTDLINMDGIYAQGIVRAGIAGAGDVQTSSAFTIYNPSTFTTRGRITANDTDVWIQTNQNINFGKIGIGLTNTSLEITDAGTNLDILQLGGSLNATGLIRGSNLVRQTQQDVTYSAGKYDFVSSAVDLSIPAMYSFLMYSPTGITLEGKIVVGVGSFDIVDGSYHGTATPPVYGTASSGGLAYVTLTTDYSTTMSIIVQQMC